ncbi:endonuclease domain-containing protein [Paramesorhizobium deserti]|uniref:endonuclease domain-containing protein n=1 Tax=Paramesorhizobium deserti TaxID=1494590 RepID=UPI001FCDD3FF|nr:endonuclease domain-containing protein [Paramesorhizobium deserti]
MLPLAHAPSPVSLREPPSPRRGEEVAGITAALFSPAGRRWPEGPDEGGFPVRNSRQPVPKRRPGVTQKARALRENETEAEYRLWGYLRNRLLNGYKFSRQILLGPYIVDFVCRKQRLIIELDGSQHANSQHDVIRTNWLNAHGYSVLRFWNDEVLKERGAVLDTIWTALEGRLFARCEAMRFYPAPQSENAAKREKQS